MYNSQRVEQLPKKLRQFAPVFLTAEEYTPVYSIPTSLLRSKVKNTVAVTTSYLRPFEGCPYLSFQQLSPLSNGLSWVINPNPGQEVIQFLTPQINYTIKWKLKAISQPTSLDKVTFLLPFEDFAYEP